MIRTKICVQDYTPHDQSLLYELSMLYWQQRGLMAWLSGEVPHRITSSYGMAKGQAAVVVAHVGDLEAAGVLSKDQPVWLLEIGGGLGTFAAHFLKALEEGCGDAGRALLNRLQFIYSDYSERTIEDASKMPALAPWVARGIVQPARFDMRNPLKWKPLGGEVRDWEGVPLLGVLSNYVCCVAGSKIFQYRRPKAADVDSKPWQELFIQVMAELPPDTFPEDMPFEEQVEQILSSVRNRTGTIKVGFDFQQNWRPVELSGVFEDNSPHHEAMIQALMTPFDEATLVYPHVYIDCMLSLRDRLLPGGLMMTSDYGSGDHNNLVGLQQKISQVYGNTVNYGVNFALFEAFSAQIEGLTLLRTKDMLRAMHHALLLEGVGVGEKLRAAFVQHFEVEQAGEALIEYSSAAQHLYEKKDFVSAARFYRRCIELDPTELSFYERGGQAAIEGGCLQDALQFFAQGLAADTTNMRDFSFQTARALAIMHRWQDSIAWYERTLKQNPHHITWTNLAAVHRHVGNLDEARAALQKAIEIKPDYERAWRIQSELDNEPLQGNIQIYPKGVN